MTSVLLSSTDGAGLGLGDLCKGPASSTCDPVSCLHSWHHPPSQCTAINGKCPRAGLELGEESCRGACEDNRAPGEAEPPPVALLVPILAQGDGSRVGGMAELGAKGSPSSSGDASVPSSDLCAWSSTSLSHSPVPGAVTATHQPVLECTGEAGNTVSGMRKHSVIP